MSNSNRSALNFDFVKHNLKDPILSFTRASTATLLDKSTGLLRSVPANTIRAWDDACGRQELWKAGSKNLLKYSNDLQNTAAWALTNLATCVKAEGDAHLISFQVGDGYWGQYVSVPAGTYTLSFKIKTSGVSTSARLQLAGVSSPVPVTAEWTTISRTAVWDAGSPYITIREGNGLTGSFLVKDAQLELGSTATAYEPNPVVIQPGLLIEGAATNYVQRSVPDGSWSSATGVTTAGAYLTAPDGTATAMPVQYDGSGEAGSYRYYCSPQAGSAGEKRVLSIWLRSVSGATTLRLYDNQGTYGVVKLTTSWQRFYLPGVGTNGVWQVLIYSDTLDNAPFSIGVWGAQQEAGTFPSSYIPTSGAAATRAADSATVDVSKIWNSSEGTIICEADFGPATGVYNHAFETTGSVMNLYRNSSSTLVAKSGYITFGTRYGRAGVAQVYAANSVKASISGESVAQTAQSVLTTTTIYLGSGGNGNDLLNGTLQRLTYLPFAMDDLTLKASSELS